MFRKLYFFIFAFLFIAAAHAQIIQFSGAPISGGATCSSSVLDTFAASPGSWTAAYSLRKLRAAYAGAAIQLTRTSDNATQDIGFNGCNPDTTTPSTFCSTATLNVGAASSRVAFPTGSVIYIFNKGPNAVFYQAGNSSVTATTSSTALTFGTGAVITVGANTNLAALVGTGYGINGTTGATLHLTNCAASIIYDQSSGNSNNQVQATANKRLGYLPNGQGSLPVLFGCLTCGMKAADSASYKTTTVNTLAVMTFGQDITSANFNYAGIGYPTTTSANASNMRWGLANTGTADIISSVANGNDGNNDEGLGGIYRGQYLTQWDWSTGGGANVNGTQLFASNSFTPTYPNAVGMTIMSATAGDGSPGMFAEGLVASGTQSARNSISSNQMTYWGINLPLAQFGALTDPLGDGFNWNRVQHGGFNSNHADNDFIVINGTTYSSDSAWNDYSQWVCTNCITTGGRKGDMVRFVNTSFDVWDGTYRSELDGANVGSGTSGEYGFNVDVWLAYSFYVEPGTAYTASWNTVGQYHITASNQCCVFSIDLLNDQLRVSTVNNATEVGTTRYTSPTITRGQWYNLVFHIFQSGSTGTNDTFQFWCDCVTPGTMVLQSNVGPGASIFGGNGNGNAGGYWKYGNYRETGAILPTLAVRYGNMQICSAGAQCTSKYGTTDLSAQTTTPLPSPSH